MAETNNSWMGLLSTLKGFFIKLNPRSWFKPQNLQTKQIKNIKPQKIEESKTLKTAIIKSKNKSFVDLHLEVVKKVDILIEQMKQDTRFDDKTN